uniref:THAP domain-containing protein 1 n=1 Tax=Oryzias melastigma TaxID=30732 RepID=A0A3B3BPM3_ORYME
MGKRCVVMFCRNSLDTGHSVHVFPKNPVLRRQWSRFVEVKRANFKLTENSVIFGAHFEKECMRNALQTAMGYSVKTLLFPDAVPTIQPAPTEEQMVRQGGLASQNDPPDSQCDPAPAMFQPLRNLLSPACQSSHSVQSVFHRQHHQTLTLRTTRLTSPLQRPERRKQISQKSKFSSQKINFMM